ncbi:alpha/beta hydrolase [Enemella evansiae]|uniref:alpha/beta hydrolase n=1 Tax=Enemella evansiae TaxID=2016499 RepID=UPI000B964F20|nr:alpha/beta hydrolase [Enemella evansiae]OYN93023.1 alpha/beta hydrolase [Enemella evansiae]OYO04144.1 alpha/beta hydrolase [Enemella evansiae]
MPILNTPEATLHYQLTGTGPLLAISQSGEGDADRSADLIPHLTGRYRVLTYDRRGLSRSSGRAGTPPASIADHASDLHHLLAAVTDRPAILLGCSLGAAIGLHLAVTHPGQLATLIAHEPITPWLLPDDEAWRHRAELAEIRDRYESDGLSAAIAYLAETLGIRPAGAEGEPGRTDFPMDENRIRNFDHFLRHDVTAAITDDLDAGSLADAGTRIIPAAGRATPRTVYDYRCAEALSAVINRPVWTFPGGHNGNLTHPARYASELLTLLDLDPQ